MPTATALPRWDMSVVFPGLDSEEYKAAFASFKNDIGELEKWFADEAIAKPESPTVDDTVVRRFEKTANDFNAILVKSRILNVYIAAFTTTDSRDELALARRSEMDTELPRLRKLGKQLTAWE